MALRTRILRDRVAALLVVIVALCGVVRPAGATIVYSNGLASLAGGIHASDRVIADDFTLTGNTAVSGIELDVIRPAGSFITSIAWSIYTDLPSGGPGPLVSTGTALSSGFSVAPIGAATSYFTATWTFASSVDLLGGTHYWLGVRYNPDLTGNSLCYSTDTHGNAPWQIILGNQSWTPSAATGDIAFRLTGVPAPTAGAAVLLWAAMFGARRKLRR